jgi:hypothetical protein
MPPILEGCYVAATVTERLITAAKALVARRVGIVSAARRVIGSCSGSTDGRSTDANRHSTGYRCTTIDATASNATVIYTTAGNATASSICEGVG